MGGGGLADPHVGGLLGHGEYETIDQLRVRPGADLPAGRPTLHPLLQPGVDRRRMETRSAPPPRRPFLRPPGARHPRGPPGPQPGFAEVWTARSTPTSRASRSRPMLSYAHSRPTGTFGGKRLAGHVNGELLSAFDMAAMGKELQPHTHAQVRPLSSWGTGETPVAGAAPREEKSAYSAARAGAGSRSSYLGHADSRRGVTPEVRYLHSESINLSTRDCQLELLDRARPDPGTRTSVTGRRRTTRCSGTSTTTSRSAGGVSAHHSDSTRKRWSRRWGRWPRPTGPARMTCTGACSAPAARCSTNE